MEVAIYSRVSTDEQRESGFSLQDQLRRLKQHCESTGKTIIKHYEDDHSAKNFLRPSFQEFLKDLKERKIKPRQLICVRWDRFSRNLEESLSMIQTLKAYGVQLHLLENNVDLTTPENYLPYIIQMALPQVENERRGLNTKQGMRQAMRQGRWMWKAPVGYTNDKFNRTVIKGAHAPLVVRAFEEVGKGLKSADCIRKELNQLGFKCSKQNFLNMLKSPFYTGKIVIEAWRNEPEEIVTGIHEPLISAELFQRVQTILKGRNRKQPKLSKFKPLFPLRGHLLCRQCGHKLTASTSQGRNRKYHYYHCQQCNRERFHAEEANQLFEQFLGTIRVNKEIVDLYSQILRDVFEQNEGSKEKRINEIEARVNACLDKLNVLDNKFLSGTIGDDDYTRMSKGLKDDINRMQREREEAAITETNYDKHFRYGVTLLSHLPYYYSNAPIELKHKLVGSIFPDNLIFEDNNYRTAGGNSLLSLVCSDAETYKRTGKEKAGKTADLSTLAPPAGLEPATL